MVSVERRRSRLEEWIIAASSPIPRTIEGSSEGIFLLMRCISPASPSCSIYITHLTVDLSQGYQRLVFFPDDFFTTFFVFFETATFAAAATFFFVFCFFTALGFNPFRAIGRTSSIVSTKWTCRP